MKHPRACILVLARQPVAGRVKTRLIPALGEDGARRLHVQLLQRQLRMLEQAQLCDFQLWVDGSPQDPIFAPYRGIIRVQRGSDLGEKMHDALRSAQSSYAQTIVIGSDCPGLDIPYLEQAVKGLEAGFDAVLGPARDGGYVLLGLQGLDRALFRGLAWGTGRVLAQTRRRLRELQFSYQELEALEDIDREEDLPLLRKFGISLETGEEVAP